MGVWPTPPALPTPQVRHQLGHLWMGTGAELLGQDQLAVSSSKWPQTPCLLGAGVGEKMHSLVPKSAAFGS